MKLSRSLVTFPSHWDWGQRKSRPLCRRELYYHRCLLCLPPPRAREQLAKTCQSYRRVPFAAVVQNTTAAALLTWFATRSRSKHQLSCSAKTILFACANTRALDSVQHLCYAGHTATTCSNVRGVTPTYLVTLMTHALPNYKRRQALKCSVPQRQNFFGLQFTAATAGCILKV